MEYTSRRAVLDANRDMHERSLLDVALAAQQRAYAPYSHFCVGAALLVARRNGSTVMSYGYIGGCNVENAAFGSTICAERGAIMRAIAQGEQPDAIVACFIIGPSLGASGPCGACRQMLAEFSPPDDPIMVFCGDGRGVGVWQSLTELLPAQFPDPRNVELLRRP